MAEARFDQVTKRFGETTALHELSLTAEDGEFVVLVGPSGCGKTTALRCLAGLEEPDEGRVFIGDEDITWVEPKDRDVAMVFQNYALYPYMTVFDNMGFPMKMRKAPKADIRQRVGEVAEMLGLSDLLDRKPRELSGGQQQRVALGRAIVREPAVFLMDEPLSNLDARLRAQTRTELSKLHRQLGTTTIYVTHDQVEAMTMGSRIAVMRDGHLLQVAPPLEIYRKPVDTFVASFMGSPPMNLINATVDRTAQRLVTPFGSLPVGERRRAEVGEAERVIVGMRPEHLAIVGDGDTDDTEFVLSAEIQVVEELGSDLYVYADPGPIAARIDPDIVVNPGEVLRFAVRSEHLHLFDHATGKRLTDD